MYIYMYFSLYGHIHNRKSEPPTPTRTLDNQFRQMYD